MTALRSPRVWLYAAGFWLVLAALVHVGFHVRTFVLEHGMVGLREFAMNAMKQADSFDPLQPSLWRQFRAFSVAFALLPLLGGTTNLVVVVARAPARVLRAVALMGTVFWTLAFVPFAVLDPVVQAIVVCAIAVPLHAIAYVTADREATEATDQGKPL